MLRDAALLLVCVSALGATGPGSPPIRAALDRMYNFDFEGANRILDAHIAQVPEDPLGPSFRAASLLFQELHRLRVLEGEFFADDKRLIEKKGMQPDARIGQEFYRWVEQARQRAQRRLAGRNEDTDAIFAMCITAGLVTDYVALIEKRQLGSLQFAKESHQYAVRLLQLDPSFTDAYMTTGLTEYLLGSVPFFVRWFIRFDGARGDKLVAVQNLERVVEEGRYLGPFAKILLAIIHLREKRIPQCHRLLEQLARQYPDNPLFRKELERVGALLRKPR